MNLLSGSYKRKNIPTNLYIVGGIDGILTLNLQVGFGRENQLKVGLTARKKPRKNKK